MKKVTIGILAVIGSIVLLILFIGVVTSNKAVPKSTFEIKNSPPAKVISDTALITPASGVAASNWAYSERVDNMDSKTSFYAQNISNNTIDLKSPYGGGSSLTLTLQYRKGDNDVLLSVSKGQILAGIEDEKKIRIKFDDEKAFFINCGGTSDYRSDVIFLYPSAKIISKLKIAKHVTIEPEFYQDGFQQVDFDVSGLKWQH